MTVEAPETPAAEVEVEVEAPPAAEVDVEAPPAAEVEADAPKEDAAAPERKGADPVPALRRERSQLKAELHDVRTKLEASEQRAESLARELLSARIVAAAAKAGFADPTDAAAMLSGAEFEDAKAIDKAVAKLVEDKPYLRTPATVQPALEQGVRDDTLPDNKPDWNKTNNFLRKR